jgi:hypothetical protein
MTDSPLRRISASLLLGATSALAAWSGRVVDAATHQAIPGAIVTAGETTAATEKDGRFQIAETPQGSLSIRAVGYRQTTAAAALRNSADIPLTPFHVNAMYLSVFGVGSKVLRDPVIAQAAAGKVNAIVIDIKDDKGLIPYPSAVPLAARLGGNKIITVHDIRGLIQDLHAKGLYLIARIVCFKDGRVTQLHPELAVKTSDGKVYTDKGGIQWLDASRKEAWDYPIDIAVEAARNGFDEIQFDYVRFPDAKSIVYSVPNDEQHRVDSLAAFLKEARRRLAPYNVFMAADVFGYISWNTNDTDIGQRLDKIGPNVDYMCPMLYPSGFQYGIPGFRNPVANSYDIVKLSLDRAIQRSELSPKHFRPWIQAFRDYAFDKREFGAKEIDAQIKAANDAGAAGWMLWNPRNVYPDFAVKPAK